MGARRKRGWLSCPGCHTDLFDTRGFHLEGERRRCEICGTETRLRVKGLSVAATGWLEVAGVTDFGQSDCSGSCGRVTAFRCRATCDRAKDALAALHWKRLRGKGPVGRVLKRPGGAEKIVASALQIYDTAPVAGLSRETYKERVRAALAYGACATSTGVVN